MNATSLEMTLFTSGRKYLHNTPKNNIKYRTHNYIYETDTLDKSDVLGGEREFFKITPIGSTLAD